MTIWTAATAIIVLHYHPELLAERLARRKGDRSWDAAMDILDRKEQRP